MDKKFIECQIDNVVFRLAATGTAAKFSGNFPADVPSAAKHDGISFLTLNSPVACDR